MPIEKSIACLLATLGASALSMSALAADTLKVGMVLPMSGPFAAYGKQIEHGARLYLQQSGGSFAGRKVELIVKDDTGIAPEISKRAAQELVVKDKVDVLAAYAKAGGALEAMAAQVYRLGDRAGNGSKVKIINQLLAGVHIAAAAEAMALGLREGVDPAALYEVITHSAGNSWMFENRMAHVLAGDYTPLSAVDIFVKDLGLVLDLARASKFPLPLSSTAHQMFMQASTAGFAKEDDSAVIKIFPGIELPKS